MKKFLSRLKYAINTEFLKDILDSLKTITKRYVQISTQHFMNVYQCNKAL